MFKVKLNRYKIDELQSESRARGVAIVLCMVHKEHILKFCIRPVFNVLDNFLYDGLRVSVWIDFYNIYAFHSTQNSCEPEHTHTHKIKTIK